MFENNDSILRVFKVIELCESKLIKDKDKDKDKEKKRQWRYHIENLVLGACVISFFSALILIFIMDITGFLWLRSPSLYFLLVTYIAGIAQPFVMLIVHGRSISNFFKDPKNLILTKISVSSAVDTKYLPMFSRYPLRRLELVALELKSGKDAFDKRISLVVGAISRVGIVPGLFALLFTWQKAPISGGWLEIIAYSLPGLYLMGFWAHMHNLKIERMSRLLDFVIEDRRKDKKLSDTIKRLKERAKS
ncbi:hypothetical protein [Rheinheimera faecalis]|uniref:hypothetical protein n=1 Tax=Rheinheimera faecalis TaxID=2901141 RepID=UPI001E632839|nr:hypothetical protein [Rheinheimera faecalis]